MIIDLLNFAENHLKCLDRFGEKLNRFFVNYEKRIEEAEKETLNQLGGNAL